MATCRGHEVLAEQAIIPSTGLTHEIFRSDFLRGRRRHRRRLRRHGRPGRKDQVRILVRPFRRSW
ncbi:hypothetical protein AGR4C_Lc10130 [Agrobacterium tumefaciens str. Kerr 14]|uniref:Uncharacterized protein n=1 Tax=Agrobacterium tumefaciens str. Kerr 14 TaxID=1183424 RepID=A0A1S7QZK0_AGRTU|nr:hypothetical protein AGR4C_Lc10130 [Agrobacterium tumefaciens str. Kerr 14]